jgi:thermitase
MKFSQMAVIGLLVSSPLFANYSPTELVVKLKLGKTLPQLSHVKSVKNLFGQMYVLHTDGSEAVYEKLSKDSSVEYVERNFKADKNELPKAQKANSVEMPFAAAEFNDPQVGRIWSFQDASRYGVSVNSAYREYGTQSTQNIIVAIVDTGIDYQHEDLKDVVWKNENEVPANGIDDDQNGYIDDIYGINTLIRDAQGRATSNNKDTHSHGTHVAGTIGARQNNGIGIAGIASNVKLMGIRTVPNNSDETDVDVAEAFVYAAKNGAKIINCSFGKGRNEGGNLIPETLKYIKDNYGVLVVAAAGNDSSDIDKNPTWPASHTSDNLLVVASTTNSGAMSGFSNYGKTSVDVAAPGSSIFSTTPGNKYESMSGTSMASPTTAGVAAEVLSHFPNLTPIQLKEVLMNSVTKVDRFTGKMISGGRVDLLKALELARTIK